MGELLIFNDKKAKSSWFLRKNQLDEEQLKNYLFDKDYETLKSLKSMEKIKLSVKKPVLFYPGCGSDVIFPLYYVKNLFSNIKNVKLILVDILDSLELIKSNLFELGIKFKNQRNGVKFYWGDIFVNLVFYEANVDKILDNVSYDIYFERNFRIMRSEIQDYEKRVFSSLNSGGVLISDNGFEEFKLKRIKIDDKISSYGNMVVGVKEK